ncbi:MAG TPA: tetratricopeptide repeat protein [Afifellaceae bacterium]|nr:tetratricopeptide repeat protein [Afifellaceae bacterium]
MQTNRLIIAALAAGIAGITGIIGIAGKALAFDPDATPREAFLEGYTAYKNGDTQIALDGLSFAAEKGHRAALWKLGQMYATGDGVAADDREAFRMFSRIVSEYRDNEPVGREARLISRAFVALGGYYQAGIAGFLPANQIRAREFFRYAASYFRDAEAQYRLADMYLNGQGGEENSRLAARWFMLAARKDHVGAQVMLGHLMLEGLGVRRSTVSGLMWLSIAQRRRKSDEGIRALLEQAYAAANEMERSEATALAEDWISNQN